MNTIIAPKKLANKEDLVVIPRREYQELLELKKFKEFKPTSMQKRAFIRAENNLRKGKTLSYNELVKKLGFTN